jgi:hypothetical protein
MMSCQAVFAGVAWYVVGDKDPIPHIVLLYVLPCLSYGTCDLMTQNQGSPGKTVPFHDVTAADATCFYLYQQFVRSYGRDRHLLQAYIIVIIVYGSTHRSCSY